MQSGGPLVERVFDEVVTAAALSGRTKELALGAVLGQDDLQAALAGEVELARPPPPVTPVLAAPCSCRP